MHYFSDQPILRDYFGLFCEGLQKHVSKSDPDTGFVGIMSHGCSGDIWRRDYMTWGGKDESTIEGYTQGLLKVAMDLYDKLEYESAEDIDMAQAELEMNYGSLARRGLSGLMQSLMTSPTISPRTDERFICVSRSCYIRCKARRFLCKPYGSALCHRFNTE